MNRTDKINLIVGIVVVVLVAGAAVALLFAYKSRSPQGEYVLLTELPAKPGIYPGCPVMLGEQKVGEVERVLHSNSPAKVGVRMRIKPETFRLIGKNASAWLETVQGGKAVIHLDSGEAPAMRTLVKIKAVKGLKKAPGKLIRKE